MSLTPQEIVVERMRRTSVVCAIFVFSIGGLVLDGWSFDIASFTHGLCEDCAKTFFPELNTPPEQQ